MEQEARAASPSLAELLQTEQEEVHAVRRDGRANTVTTTAHSARRER